MIKKWIVYFIILTILPYLVAGALIVFFGDPEIRDMIFRHNILNVFLPIVIVFLITIVFTIGCVYRSQTNHWDSYYFTKAMLTIKIIQIPAYIAIFVISVICFVTVFAMIFTLLLAVFDFYLLVMSGLNTGSAIILAKKEYPEQFKFPLWSILFFLQFVFLADVVATIYLFLKLRKIKKTDNTELLM